MPLPKTGYTGISFPFRFTPDYTGGVAKSTTTPNTADHILEAIQQIVGTSPVLQERWHLPEFGAQPQALLWEPMSDAMAGGLESYLRTKLQRWEDRVTVHELRIVSSSKEGKLFSYIDLRIQSTTQRVTGTLEV